MSQPAINVADLQKLKAMIGGDIEDLQELVDDFLANLPQQTTALRAAAQSQDWGAMRITAHSCKSNARDLGAAHLSELCAELELQCKSGAPADLDTQLDSIEEVAAQAIAALKAQDLAHV